MSKRCPSCDTVKAEVDFYTQPKRPDGLSGWCKACEKAKAKEYGRRYRHALYELRDRHVTEFREILHAIE